MKQTLTNIVRAFSPFEFVLFAVLSTTFILSSISLAGRITAPFMENVPRRGGSLTEGIVGSPRFVNPLLALSDADRDMAALVYSGLLLRLPSGDLLPDLALSYAVSDDGLSYTFILRDDVIFHDGEPVTADDVVFTVGKTQDPALKSPKRASWDSVLVEKINEQTVRFTLKQPYAPFLENATLGILPEHLWKEADAEQFQFSTRNTEPVGSGPFSVSELKRNNSGIPASYTLKAFPGYALGRPHLDRITLHFYPNEAALVDGFMAGKIKSMSGVSPVSLLKLPRDTRIETASLPRVFAVFFNQNQATLFTNKEVRVALDAALDKERVVEEVLYGYGTAIDGPIPPGTLQEPVADTGEDAGEGDEAEGARDTLPVPDRIEEARAILEKNGWKFDEEERMWKKETKKETYVLSFSLATSNTPELSRAAEIVREEWQRLGAIVNLHVFETGDLSQNVIRPRKYDALLFGEVVGRELDLFAFWHSSQRNDPGLNIALYANIAADKYLEDARRVTLRSEREENYRAFAKEIGNDAPAVFLYAPEFIYIVPKNLKGLSLGSVTTPEERFASAHEWYIETNRLWKIFTQWQRPLE